LAVWLPPESGGHQTPRWQWSPFDYAIHNTIRYADGSFPLRHAMWMATTGGDNLLRHATPSALRMAATDGHDRMASFPLQYPT